MLSYLHPISIVSFSAFIMHLGIDSLDIWNIICIDLHQYFGTLLHLFYK